MSNKMIKKLQLAHAIEIGAYNAYFGHYKSIKPLDNPIRGKIKFIQVDELHHREKVSIMLQQLGAQPNYILDAILYIIGRTISAACYVMGYRAAMWGAKIMEIMGADIYRNLAYLASRESCNWMVNELHEFADAEKEHEKFFKLCLEQRAGSGQ